jgi:LmbE family N-acetylglucosaminyl deacetylase
VLFGATEAQNPQIVSAFMATAVFFHAHPDDEAIATGGTMARMASEGHRVILVTATRGELGEVPPGMLQDGQTLSELREIELEKACAVLGVSRNEYLGYLDSGMSGEASNEDPACFWQADVEEAAQRLAAILDQEHADVLTIYDEHGTYGHPDHVQVHRVGARAAQVAKTPAVFMATQNRDRVIELFEHASDLGVEPPDQRGFAVEEFGEPAERITTAVDVSAFLNAKRQAMQAHASQISESSFFLSMPEEAFALIWGSEWYIRLGARRAEELESTLLDSLPG